MKIFTFILIISCLISLRCHAQSSHFRVYDLTGNLAKYEKKIDGMISKAKSLDEVREVVFQTVTESSGTILICYEEKGKRVLWKYTIGGGTLISKELIITGSRGGDLPTFYTFSDIARYFRDTVVIGGTLHFIVDLNDQNISIDGYQHSIVYGDKVDSSAIPVLDKNKLAILYDKAIFNGKTVQLSIFHKNHIADTLSKCKLHFLKKEDLSQLRWLRGRLIAKHPTYSSADIYEFLISYIKAYYGRIDPENLKNWLEGK